MPLTGYRAQIERNNEQPSPSGTDIAHYDVEPLAVRDRHFRKVFLAKTRDVQ